MKSLSKTHDQIFKEAVMSNTSVASTLKALGLVPSGGNYRMMKIKLARLNLTPTHWLGQGHLKGKTHNWGKKRPLKNILIRNSPYTSSTSSLKARLIKEGLLEYNCSNVNCGIINWNNQPLTLQLEHKNGDNTDNRLENLCLLCPNCHSQTSTFAGRNIGSGFGHRSKALPLCFDCKSEISREAIRCKSCAGKSWERKPRKRKPLPLCLDCKAEISKRAVRCRSCSGKQREAKTSWPPIDELIQAVRASSYVAIGKQLGVSDNAVRHHIKHHSC